MTTLMDSEQEVVLQKKYFLKKVKSAVMYRQTEKGKDWRLGKSLRTWCSSDRDTAVGPGVV